MIQLSVRVSYNRYDSKPPQNHNGIITNQLKRNPQTASPKQLAEYLCQGYSVCATYPSKKVVENEPVYFIGFDIDHADVDLKERLASIHDTPTIAYHTFSHALDDIRYRFIYVFNSPLDANDFYVLQEELIERNHLQDHDNYAKNINRLFHGTNHSVYYSGVCYGTDLKPVQVEDEILITRDTANLPLITETPKEFTFKYTESDITSLTSVGVSPDMAEYYFTHSWSDFRDNYTLTTTIFEQSQYTQMDEECYAVAPDEFYSLPRQWRHFHEDHNGYTCTITKPRKWEDGQHRGAKLYQAILTYRKLNLDATPNDLLFCAIREYLTFYYNRNADGKTIKYDHRGFARTFISGMNADITRYRKPLKHSNIIITSNKVNKHAEAPRASAKERHKKILALYDPNLDTETNLLVIRERLNIHLTERTLKKVLQKNGILTAEKHLQKTEKENLFQTLFDPSKTDAENQRAICEKAGMGRATYYRLKKKLVPSNVVVSRR